MQLQGESVSSGVLAFFGPTADQRVDWQLSDGIEPGARMKGSGHPELMTVIGRRVVDAVSSGVEGEEEVIVIEGNLSQFRQGAFELFHELCGLFDYFSDSPGLVEDGVQYEFFAPAGQTDPGIGGKAGHDLDETDVQSADQPDGIPGSVSPGKVLVGKRFGPSMIDPGNSTGNLLGELVIDDLDGLQDHFLYFVIEQPFELRALEADEEPCHARSFAPADDALTAGTH
jgi:hypothetical protein